MSKNSLSQNSGAQKYDSNNIQFTKEHYQEIVDFNQFMNKFRPIFMTANIPRSNDNKLLETKWHEFCRNNPFFESDISDCSSNEDLYKKSSTKQKKKRVQSSEAEDSTEEPKSRNISKRFRSNELSDEEFEKALIISSESSNSDSDNGLSSKRKKKFKERGIVHNKLCVKCQRGGKKVFCRNCPNAYHLDCLDNISTTGENKKGQWLCPRCITLKKLKNRILCAKCSGDKDLIECQTCRLAYHSSCMISPLMENTVSSWRCHICTCPPLKTNISRIISWRWKDSSKNCRIFFVKYHDKSFYECSWVDELQLEVHCKLLHFHYVRKNTMDEPPVFEYELDTQDDRYQRLLKMGSPTGEERVQFEENFYKYGIEPEWLIVHRVIADKITDDGTNKFLVKWRELGYSFCTWENGKSENISEFQKEIKFYEKMKRFHLANQYDMKSNTHVKNESDNGVEKKFFIPPTKPLTDLKIKLEEQPVYLDSSEFKLHPYQMEGLNWLRFSWSNGCETILADEMGLGKTVQTAVFLYSLYKEGHCPGPFLISVPLSTIGNWEREMERWAPDFYCVTYVGDKADRKLIKKHEFSFRDKNGLKTSSMKFNVLITNYEMTSVDKFDLSSIGWRIVVVDEAHRLKNTKSVFFKCLTDYNIPYKLMLTGTPLQNNLDELYSLLSFMCPNKFNVIEEFQANFADITKKEQIKRLHKMLAPHMLRRLKTDVFKTIPSKSECIVRVELSSEQKKFYKFVLTKNYAELNKTGCAVNRTSLNSLFMNLRKCCNHTYLFAKAQEVAAIQQNGNYEMKALTEGSGKLILLEKMLMMLKSSNHRVLLFSQFTTTLDIIEEFLENLNILFVRIDGSVNVRMRQQSIDRFNAPGSKYFVFLISTKAGGLGINLASADTVIFYDSDWNPHNDIQALSRAHRIGQTKTVMIYRLVCRHTVEEKIIEVAKKKMMLTHLVVRSDKKKDLSKQELEEIVAFGFKGLFIDNNNENEAIHYDDKAIECLLDRSQKGVAEKESWINEYLSTFKVASYTSRKDGNELNEDIADLEHWKNVVKKEHEKLAQEDANKYGRGKRILQPVNYCFNRKSGAQ